MRLWILWIRTGAPVLPRRSWSIRMKRRNTVLNRIRALFARCWRHHAFTCCFPLTDADECFLDPIGLMVNRSGLGGRGALH
jgi:hypothetical protein